MRIAFLGSYKSFDFNQIGGMDSIARRLGRELAGHGAKVSFVHFNCPVEEIKFTPDGIGICYFRSFNDALEYIADNADHVLTFYIPPKERFTWIRFRKSLVKNIKFHRFFSGWPESWVRRNLGFAEALVAPYNGVSFCVSPRLEKYLSRYLKRTALLLPPVPEDYFLSPGEKPRNEQLRITYIGRIDPGKGATVAIDLFRLLAKETPHIETRICGYPWRHRPETMRLHEELMAQSDILYEPVDFEGYSQAVEDNLRKVLRETDVLFLPYDKLSSTVDMPLLLLEGMASLCCVITKPFGNIPEIYGESRFIVPEKNFISRVVSLLEKISIDEILEERERVYMQNKKLNFKEEEVAKQFIRVINE